MSVPESVLAGMRETIDLFCSEVGGKRNMSALDRVYTEGARVLPPGGAAITGRDAIKAFWKSTLDNLNVKSVSMESVEVHAMGDALSEIGRATLFLYGPTNAHVKYVVVWKKEDDVWKWDIDIWN